jgi:hypothetical protein
LACRFALRAADCSALFSFACPYDCATSVFPSDQPKARISIAIANRMPHAVVTSCWATE